MRAHLQRDYTEIRRAPGAELPKGASERRAEIVEEMIADMITSAASARGVLS